MQVLGRLCEGCGEAITRLGDGNGCGGCDLFLCTRCLRGTARCPSCQRAFADTRDDAPRAAQKGDARVESGKQETIAVAVSWAVALGIQYMLARPSLPLLVAQLGVVTLAFAFFFRGRAWARWLLIALASLDAVASVIAAALALESAGPWLASFGLALVFGWNGRALLRSEHIDRYLRAQRLRYP